eukprot:365940-Chlamydomonas_euryale.AAC.22
MTAFHRRTRPVVALAGLVLLGCLVGRAPARCAQRTERDGLTELSFIDGALVSDVPVVSTLDEADDVSIGQPRSLLEDEEVLKIGASVKRRFYAGLVPLSGCGFGPVGCCSGADSWISLQPARCSPAPFSAYEGEAGQRES